MIDRDAGLVFKNETELFDYFDPYVKTLEEILRKNRAPNDIEDSAVEDLESELDFTLEEPAEIWYDEKTLEDLPVFYFIRPLEDIEAYHVACCYVSSENEPTFIFLHFLTKDIGLLGPFRKGDLVYDRAFEEVGFGMLEGDSLTEGDPLSMGLFLAMLKLRSDKDVPFDKFASTGEDCREETIEKADEIWRSHDSNGNTLVTFVKEFTDHEIKDLVYIAVTQEDSQSGTHSLLFSFPTSDPNLADRYRLGENLQAEEVSQESSH